jgi:hypothetical protein
MLVEAVVEVFPQEEQEVLEAVELELVEVVAELQEPLI